MQARVLFASLCVVLVLFVAAVQPAHAVDLTITLKPGQAASVPLKFWCLDYGLPYPKTVSGPGQRAPDAVVSVLMAAIARNTVNTNPYQTELAIWRATTGKFNDYAKLGIVQAQEVYSDSLTFKVPPVPATPPSLDQLIVSGTLTATLLEFGPQQDPANPNLPGEPFFGTARLVITNTSKSTVRFVFLEGSTFSAPPGVNAQHLVSHQDTSQVTQLPPTGDDLQAALPLQAALAALGGLACLSGAALLWRRVRVVRA
jgi:hypothetical protein